jgi:hypothetical protein
MAELAGGGETHASRTGHFLWQNPQVAKRHTIDHVVTSIQVLRSQILGFQVQIQVQVSIHVQLEVPKPGFNPGSSNPTIGV